MSGGRRNDGDHPEKKVEFSMAITRRATSIAAVGAVAALALAACGGSGGGTSSSSAASGGAPTYNGAVDGVVQPSDKTGGTLKLIEQSDVDSYDPARTYYAYSWDIQRLFTRSLMGFSPLPGAKGTAVVPDLAQAAGVSNADKTVWTYKLKSGLKFSDGTPITSKDIKYAIERLFATDIINGGPSSYYLSLLTPASGYKGPYADPTGDLSTVKTPDDSTIEFDLTKSFADFDYLMALPTSAPVPKAKDTKADYGKMPVSSGPYMFQSFTPNKETVWVRNPNWDQSTDTIRKPMVDSVTLTVVSNQADGDKRVTSGAVDMWADGGLMAASRPAVINDPTKKANADNPVTGFTRYIVVNQTVPPLDNKACREAIFYAFNKADYIKIRGGSTGGDVANTMTPPIIPGYDPTFNPYPNGSDNTGDLTKAKEKLTECGQPNGFSTAFAYATSAVGSQLFASVQANLARVGITLKGAPADSSAYYSTWIGSPKNMKAKGIGLAIAGWGADFPTPYGFWQSIANGNAIVDPGNSNYPSLNDPVVNQALGDLTKSDPSQTATLGKTVDQGVMADAVYLPVEFDKMFSYRNPRLTNVYLNGGVGNYYDYVNIGTNDGK
jgi:peptide/nickel transport system substrate-binding protein